MNHITAEDLEILGETTRCVAIKQYNVNKLGKYFKKDLIILKKIKKLKLKNNGGFPLILSAKVSWNIGEILTTYVGIDLYAHLDLNQSVSGNLKFKGWEKGKCASLGVQIGYQLEVLQKLGYTHNDIKLQNILYQPDKNLYGLSDFSQACKIQDIGNNQVHV
jgi:serine/threonine protein kinase